MGKVFRIFFFFLGVIFLSCEFGGLDAASSSHPGEASSTVQEGEGHGNDTGHGNSSEHHEVHRYQVAHFDFPNVATPFIVSVWIVFASGAKMGFHLNNKLSSLFPESCMLILLGCLLAGILWGLDVKHFILDSHTFFIFLLPPIILDAGYFMPNRAFFDNFGTIILYAVIGTLWNTILIGFSLWGFSYSGGIGAIPYELDMLQCLVFASLLAAVDPVAVLAVFEEVHVNEMLYIVVFGESLLNDGVTVVLYHMFEGFSEIGQANILPVDIISGIASFFVVALGGSFIGVIVGFVAAFISRFTSHVRVIEPLLVFVMGYLSYLIAEMFHLSSILSTTFCGITMRGYVEANVSPKSRTTIKYMLKLAASVCETIIFMLLGISTVNANHEWNTEFVILTVLFCLVYRTSGVIVLTYFANMLRMDPINKVEQFIMAYGGLRGAIAFALVVTLDIEKFPQARLFVTTCLVVIYFTVFIQGATIKPLVKLLGVKRASKHKNTLNEQIHSRFIDHAVAGIEDVTGFHGHHNTRMGFEHFNRKYLKPLIVRKKQLRVKGKSILNVYQRLSEAEMRSLVSTGSYSDLRRISTSVANNLNYSALHGSDPHLGSSIPSSGSFPMLTANDSSTQLDLQALEVPETRKMRDDGKIHHIMTDVMFRPRKRFSRHRRHMLPDTDGEYYDHFHYKARMHLRHVLNHYPRGQAPRANGQITENGEVGKPRKNVSFGVVTQVNRKESAGSVEAEDPDSMSEPSLSDSDSAQSDLEEAGIVFTARPPENGTEFCEV